MAAVYGDEDCTESLPGGFGAFVAPLLVLAVASGCTSLLVFGAGNPYL